MRTIILLSLLLLVHTAASAQWHRIDAGFGVTGTYAPSFSASDGTYLYTLLLAGPPYQMHFYRSSDDGTTWERMNGFPAYHAPPTFFRALANGRLMMGAASGDASQGIFAFSDDRGVTWTEVRTTAAVSVQTVEWLGGTNYLAGTNSALMIRSSDGGATWATVAGSPPTVKQLQAIGGSVIGINTTGMVSRSTDGGTSWNQVVLDASLPGPLNLASSVWRMGDNVYLKRNAGPAYVSADEGATWTAMNGPIDGFSYLAVQTSPNGQAWLLWMGNGVYLSTDGGVTATNISEGLPRETTGSFCNTAYALTNSSVIAGAGCIFAPEGSGVYRYSFSTTSSVQGNGTTSNLDLGAPNPNPTAGELRLAYTLATPADIRLTMHDLLGREVAVLARGTQEAGTHHITLDAANLPQGTYWIHLRSGSDVAIRTVRITR